MTVAELRAKLDGLPDEMPVFTEDGDMDGNTIPESASSARVRAIADVGRLGNEYVFADAEPRFCEVGPGDRVVQLRFDALVIG